MQKVLRINIQSRNQAAKKIRKQAKYADKKDWKAYDQQRVSIRRSEQQTILNERKHRREDWIAGPLAPDRNTGQDRGRYGAVPMVQLQAPDMPKVARRGPRSSGWSIQGQEGLEGEGKEWEGYANEGNIIVGDRVCVVNGRQEVKGQIGVVKSLNLARGEVIVEGLNLGDTAVPDWSQSNPNSKKVSSTELPVKFDDVRLVVSGEHRETGAVQYLIVKYLRGGAPYLQQRWGSNIPRHTRYIGGTGLVVPWPEAIMDDHERGEQDTSRQLVEQYTYIPKLIDPAIPAGVMDELRSKTTSQRSRHDTTWIAQKVIEDARSSWWAERKVVTPKQELAEQRVRENLERLDAARQRGPSEETLEMLRTT